MPCLSRVLAVPAFALLLACDLGPPDRHERLTLDAADLRTLKIVAGAGDLAIEGDPAATHVAIVAGIHGDHTTIAHTRVGDTLELSEHCSGWERCGVDWHVVVPAAVAADLETGAGDIRVAGLAAALHADTGAGDIDLADLTAPAIDVQSGAGDITGHDLQCPQFRGDTGFGDLELELTARPHSVWGNTGAGDIGLTLPGGAYQLDLDTGAGDIDLTGIRRVGKTDAALRLHTGAGDIGVAG